MKFLEVPWLDCSIMTTLVGALWVALIREPFRAARWAWSSPGSPSSVRSWHGSVTTSVPMSIPFAAPVFSPSFSAARFSCSTS